jgi:hypothetical protein
LESIHLPPRPFEGLLFPDSGFAVPLAFSRRGVISLLFAFQDSDVVDYPCLKLLSDTSRRRRSKPSLKIYQIKHFSQEIATIFYADLSAANRVLRTFRFLYKDIPLCTTMSLAIIYQARYCRYRHWQKTHRKAQGQEGLWPAPSVFCSFLGQEK